MLNKLNVFNRIAENGIVAVLRGTEEEVVKTAKAVSKGGIKVIEVTMTVPNSFNVLKELNHAFQTEDTVVGMGTVLDPFSAVGAIQAGADFIVTPHLDTDIIQACHQYQSFIMPGTFTITEMVKAMKWGCDVLKLFPGDLAGPKHIKNVKGPLPNVNLLPTGGVDENNIKDWIHSGAVAVGVGSNLKKAAGKDGDVEQITAYASKLVKMVQEARAE